MPLRRGRGATRETYPRCPGPSQRGALRRGAFGIPTDDERGIHTGLDDVRNRLDGIRATRRGSHKLLPRFQSRGFGCKRSGGGRNPHAERTSRTGLCVHHDARAGTNIQNNDPRSEPSAPQERTPIVQSASLNGTTEATP